MGLSKERKKGREEKDGRTDLRLRSESGEEERFECGQCSEWGLEIRELGGGEWRRRSYLRVRVESTVYWCRHFLYRCR